jgi:hypothetical protein
MMSAMVMPQRDSELSERPIPELTNDQIIIELLQTPNHLSRWLTPIHDRTLLEFSPRRAQPSVKDVLLRMRDTETWAYQRMYAIATEVDPNLDRLPNVERSPQAEEADRRADALVVMSAFRRVRQSSTSLLRALPDAAWLRGGFSRKDRNWTIRQLAEFLVAQDREALREIDQLLAQSGARRGIAKVSQVRYDELDEPFLGAVETVPQAGK